MPFTVAMPKLSPTMEVGTIAQWHKHVGDKVAVGDLLVSVMTDKATIEFTAFDAGYLRKILVPQGKTAIVNQPIAIFTEQESESIEEYVPVEIEPQASEESSQALMPQTESFPTSALSAERQAIFTPEPPLENYEFNFPSSIQKKRIAASPLAKKLAEEKGIDLATVKGTGPGGRITSSDLDLGRSSHAVQFGISRTPDILPGTYEEETLSPMRLAIAKRLSQAKNSIPHIYVRQEVDASALFEVREQLKTGGKTPTFNDFVVRACALALREHPRVNSGFHEAAQSILLFKTIDIAIAVTVEGGIITPIIRHADYKNLGEISIEVKMLAARAKEGKLQPHEYRGGSFTISNLGMFGITDFCAIINPPQSCILTIGAIEEAPRVKCGQVVVGKIMRLVLSADHRVIDGSEAAQFLKSVQKYLENPSLLLT